jgi:Na+/melibiose symporter-like transporter
MTGYSTLPDAHQTPLAIWGVRIKTALIPALMYMVMAYIFYKFYDLEGEKKASVVRQCKEMGLTR